MRLLFCCLLILLYSSAAQAQSPKAVTDYVEKYKKIAMEEMRITGIPASVTLAQGIHESGCGCSVLACKSNNHFGIKCHNEWTGVKYHHDDDQPQECFRVYTNPEESFKDHSDFLMSRQRYAGLFKLDVTDYRGWARGLKAAGYATNPQYPQIIIGLIETYKLNEYDKGIDRPANQAALLAEAVKPKTSGAPQAQVIQVPKPQNPSPLASTEISKVKPVTANQVPATPTPAATAEAAKVKTPTPSAPIAAAVKSKAITPPVQIAEAPKPKPNVTVASPDKPKDIDISNIHPDERLINGVKAIVYKTNIPVMAIARKYNITVDELYSYNDMMPNVKFKDGEYIYLEKKKAETSYYQYELAEGETMRDVAQKFGVQVIELYRRNGINMDCEPLAGEIIVLRGNREVPIRFHVVDRNGKRTMADTANTGDGKIHKVNDSDTLYSIARQYNISVDTLIKINGLKDNDIKIGQALLVSSL